MANSVFKSRVMRLSHGMELIKLNALDPLNKSDHQLEAHHLLISKQRTDPKICSGLLRNNGSLATMYVTTVLNCSNVRSLSVQVMFKVSIVFALEDLNCGVGGCVVWQ